MSNDKKSIKSQAEDIRKELDDLIGDNDPIENVIETDPTLPAKNDLPSLPSYSELKANSSTKAKRATPEIISALSKTSSNMFSVASACACWLSPMLY